MKKRRLVAAGLLGAFCLVAKAETLRWNVQRQYGMSAQGIQKAVDEAKAHFRKTPNDIVILEFDKGSFRLEVEGPGRGIVDLSGVAPGPAGRLVFQGQGIDDTILVFAGDKHSLYGRNVQHVTFAGMHMTRKDYTVSQGLVAEVDPGKVVLDIQPGFPDPDKIFDPANQQGRYLRCYTNSKTDPLLVQEDNGQIAWARAKHVGGQRWEIELKNKNQLAGYRQGDLIGIKSKHGGQAYWFMGGSDFVFDSVKWTQETRGVFRGGFDKIQILNCVTDRSPPINGQTPCLAAPGGGPQIGQPHDPPTLGNVVKNCRFIASGDDAVAFFNAGGVIRDCYIRDAFARGILAVNSPKAELSANTVVRCPIQQSQDWQLHKTELVPNDPETSGGQ